MLKQQALILRDAVDAFVKYNCATIPIPLITVYGFPVSPFSSVTQSKAAPDWLNGLILDGIVAGVGAVLGFVPQMLVLFLLLAFLESCGYMARIAFVMDRIFRKFGLSGKSFIPMLVGVGCGVPGYHGFPYYRKRKRQTYDCHDHNLYPLRR